MAIKIDSDEITFNQSSYVDPNARVFEWLGKIYRAISKEKEEFYRSLLESGLFCRLQKAGLMVGTEVVDLELDGWAFVVEHPRILFLSYCTEWPSVMLKDAARLTIHLCQELAENNLILQDAYPWNVYFNGTKPLFIDLGSIIPAQKEILWEAYEQFRRFFLHPLFLAESGLGNVARALLFDYIDGINAETVLKTQNMRTKLKRPVKNASLALSVWLQKRFPDLPQKMRSALEPLINRVESSVGLAEIRKSFFKKVESELDGIKVKTINSHWIDYNDKEDCNYTDDLALWNAKQKFVAAAIERLRPGTVLDIGCNTGWFSLLAASKGCKVVAFDKDEGCIEHLYLTAKEKGLDVLPLVIDAANPTPAFGWRACQFPSAVERLQCDLVFALALVHHLVFSQRQSLERIVEMLAGFTKKWLLVEFPLPEDGKVIKIRRNSPHQYDYANFLQAINNHFNVLSTLDSEPKTRKLILCEKK